MSTALALMTASFQALNVFQSGEAIPATDAADALLVLNSMVGGWALNTSTLPITVREVFPLTAGKGGPSNPYTIGTNGNFVAVRPPSAASVFDAGLLLGNVTPAVEIPRSLINDEQYAAIRIKELQNSLFTMVYYNLTYSGGLGTINLWPVPNTTLHSLVLYHRQQLGSFTTLTATYDLPFGWDEAIIYNLVLRLAPVYGRAPVSPELTRLAVTSLANVKRANTQMLDMPGDPMFRSQQRPSYNINTGDRR